MKKIIFFALAAIGMAAIATTSCDSATGVNAVSGVRLDKTATTIAVGGTEILRATVEPTDALDKTITWASSNPLVATVGEGNGLVRAIAAGEATITVTTADGGMTASCEVTVEDAEIVVSVNKPTLTLTQGDTQTLRATVEPVNAAVTWSSSNAAVATVGATTGLVTAVAAGTADITATAGDKSAKCVLTVDARVIPVAGVALNKTSMAITDVEFETLTFTVEPFNATDKTVTWHSSNEGVATVTGGKVSGVAKGTVSITVRTVDGGKEDVCIVTVTEAGPIVAESNLAGTYTWDAAQTACPVGWRLPTREEMDALCPVRDNYNGFSDGRYWTSSEKENNPLTAYYVLFSTIGRCFYGNDAAKTDQNMVRCIQSR